MGHMDIVFKNYHKKQGIKWLLRKDYTKGLTVQEQEELQEYSVFSLKYRVTYYSIDNSLYGFVNGIEARCREEAEGIAMEVLKRDYNREDFVLRGVEEA